MNSRYRYYGGRNWDTPRYRRTAKAIQAGALQDTAVRGGRSWRSYYRRRRPRRRGKRTKNIVRKLVRGRRRQRTSVYRPIKAIHPGKDNAMLIRFKDYHHFTIDPPAANATPRWNDYSVTCNDPVNWNNNVEHTPYTWSQYAALFEYYSVLSCKVTYVVYNNQSLHENAVLTYASSNQDNLADPVGENMSMEECRADPRVKVKILVPTVNNSGGGLSSRQTYRFKQCVKPVNWMDTHDKVIRNNYNEATTDGLSSPTTKVYYHIAIGNAFDTGTDNDPPLHVEVFVQWDVFMYDLKDPVVKDDA